LLICHLIDTLGLNFQDVKSPLNLVYFVVKLVHLIFYLEEDLLVLVFYLELEVFGTLGQTRIVFIEDLLEKGSVDRVSCPTEAEGTREITGHFEVRV